MENHHSSNNNDSTRGNVFENDKLEEDSSDSTITDESLIAYLNRNHPTEEPRSNDELGTEVVVRVDSLNETDSVTTSSEDPDLTITDESIEIIRYQRLFGQRHDDGDVAMIDLGEESDDDSVYGISASYRAPSPPPVSEQHKITNPKERAKKRERECLNGILSRYIVDTNDIMNVSEQVYWSGGVMQESVASVDVKAQMERKRILVWQWLVNVPDDVKELVQVA